MHLSLRGSLVLMLAFSVGSSVIPGAFCKLFNTCQDSINKGPVGVSSTELNSNAPLELPFSPIEGEDIDPALSFWDDTLKVGFYISTFTKSLKRNYFKLSPQAIWLMLNNIRI